MKTKLFHLAVILIILATVFVVVDLFTPSPVNFTTITYNADDGTVTTDVEQPRTEYAKLGGTFTSYPRHTFLSDNIEVFDSENYAWGWVTYTIRIKFPDTQEGISALHFYLTSNTKTYDEYLEYFKLRFRVALLSNVDNIKNNINHQDVIDDLSKHLDGHTLKQASFNYTIVAPKQNKLF
jgi:hypothetical protein